MTRSARSLLLSFLSLTLGCSAMQIANRPRDWSKEVDFAALRTEYGDREDYKAVCEDGRPFQELVEKSRASDWSAIIVSSGPWLESCPVDLDIHFFRAVALAEVGRNEESEHHVAWYKGLVASVLASGDGRTPDTAWVVISVPEEYSIMRALRVRRVNQKLVGSQAGKKIDAIEVKTKDGKQVTVYFDPGAHFQRLGEQIEGAQGERAE